MKRWRGLLIVSLCLFVLAGMQPRLALAQESTPHPSAVDFLNPAAQIEFGQQILFSVEVQPADQVRDVRLLWQAEGEPRVRQTLMAWDGQTASHAADTANAPVRPFSLIEYWFTITLNDGSSHSSPRQRFDYTDTRYTWQSVHNQGITVHWIDGDGVFGQELLNAAAAGLDRAGNWLPVATIEEPLPAIDIWTYPTASDVQEALRIGGATWVAGHADPDLGIILVSIAPGPEQRLEMERQIPHELMHILVYHYVHSNGGDYERIPAWLSEGIASNNELFPNPEYNVLLNNAAERQSLLPFNSLCGSFPNEASQAILSYAQSTNFTRYLSEMYGVSKVQELLLAYADGLTCERGIEVTLGESLTTIENAWVSGQTPEMIASGSVGGQPSAPFLLLMGVIVGVPLLLAILRRFIPFGMSGSRG